MDLEKEKVEQNETAEQNDPNAQRLFKLNPTE